MNDRERRRALKQAYRRVRTQLMDILYEEDPAQFGSSVAAPRDEYSEEAARLMASLRGAKTEEEIRERLSEMFGEVTHQLVRRVHEIWTRAGGAEW